MSETNKDSIEPGVFYMVGRVDLREDYVTALWMKATRTCFPSLAEAERYLDTCSDTHKFRVVRVGFELS